MAVCEEDLDALFDQVSAEREAKQAGAEPTGDVYHRVGALTRQLHEALRQLGIDKTVEDAVGALPDARSRLDYIATLTGRAAERVLGNAEKAQAAQSAIEDDAKALSGRWAQVYAGSLGADAFPALAGDTRDFLDKLPARTGETREACTDIMMAQDFHDLTGQVIQRVAALVQDLESQLVKLLIEATPPERRAEAPGLSGPVVDAKGRDDVATSQAQVDELLESLGF